MNESALTYIADHTSFTTREFASALRKESPEIGRSTLYQILNTLCRTGKITRTSRGHFSATVSQEYIYSLSDIGREVSTLITEAYPLITFQIWELYQMNEFINHQFSRNTVFIEVEDMLDESVFNLIFDKYPHVLYRPTIDEYYKYSGNETLVVRKLISEAPPSYGDLKQSSLEKILADLF